MGKTKTRIQPSGKNAFFQTMFQKITVDKHPSVLKIIQYVLFHYGHIALSSCHLSYVSPWQQIDPDKYVFEAFDADVHWRQHWSFSVCCFLKDAAASYDFNDNDPDPFPRYDATNENKWVNMLRSDIIGLGLVVTGCILM